MTDPIHHQLLGHLLGALDDDEQQSVDARLDCDEECCRELTRWRRRLTPLEMMRPDFEPPPGLAERTCRYVAACMAVPAASQPYGPRRRMSPNPVPPGRVAHVGWLDMAAVALLLATTGSLMLPAIHGSRFEARLASCQDDLRQFGLALTHYSQHQQSALGRLAGNGRLTRAGVCAAGLLRDGYLTDSRRPVCPDAWLAAQGALCESLHLGTPIEPLQRPATAVFQRPATIVIQRPATAVAGGVENQYDDWPGTWRDGTTDGWRPPPSPTEVPLLADAPSADLPGQDPPSHGGRGRNLLFEDGRVGFLPSATPVDASDLFFSRGEDSAAADISTPIVFVSGR